MPIPSNLTPTTAKVITILPFTETVLAVDWALAPTNNSWPSTCDTNGFHSLWWKYTTGPTERFISVTGDSPGSINDDPGLSIWTFVGSIGTQYQIIGPAINQDYCNQLGGKFWVEMAVLASTTYYFQFTTKNNSVPIGNLIIYLQNSPNLPVSKGSLAITDDDDDRFPIVLLDKSTGAILQLLSFPAGEFGDFAPTGEVCTQNGVNNLVGVGVVVFQKDLTTSLGAVSATDMVVGIKNNGGSLFYYATQPHNPGNSIPNGPVTIKTISTSGVVGGTTWILPTNSISFYQFGISRDNSKLYYTEHLNFIVHAYDLVNHVALPDLVSLITSRTSVGRGDGFVYSDGSFFVATDDNIVGADQDIRRYSNTGTLIHTYHFGAVVINHYALDQSDDLHFWVWFKISNILAQFKKIRISDGVEIVTFNVNINQATGSPDDRAPFTVANSCPLLILSQDLVIPAELNLDGLYFVNPIKTHDSYYGGINKKIPDPTIKTALIGD